MDKLTTMVLCKANSFFKNHLWIHIDKLTSDVYCDFVGQQGNDEILKRLDRCSGDGFMMSKWGTIEYAQALLTYMQKRPYTCKELMLVFLGKLPSPRIGGMTILLLMLEYFRAHQKWRSDLVNKHCAIVKR